MLDASDIWDELLYYRWTRRLILAAIALLLVVFGDVASRNYQIGLGAIFVVFVLCELSQRFVRRQP